VVARFTPSHLLVRIEDDGDGLGGADTDVEPPPGWALASRECGRGFGSSMES